MKKKIVFFQINGTWQNLRTAEILKIFFFLGWKEVVSDSNM